MSSQRCHEREGGSIAELLQMVEKIAAEGKEAVIKVTCQADLDHEAAVQQAGRWRWSGFGVSLR